MAIAEVQFGCVQRYRVNIETVYTYLLTYLLTYFMVQDSI
jgi:hypothetical protein